jgi:hypothetical protein
MRDREELTSDHKGMKIRFFDVILGKIRFMSNSSLAPYPRTSSSPSPEFMKRSNNLALGSDNCLLATKSKVTRRLDRLYMSCNAGFQRISTNPRP